MIPPPLCRPEAGRQASLLPQHDAVLATSIACGDATKVGG